MRRLASQVGRGAAQDSTSQENNYASISHGKLLETERSAVYRFPETDEMQKYGAPHVVPHAISLLTTHRRAAGDFFGFALFSFKHTEAQRAEQHFIPGLTSPGHVARWIRIGWIAR